MSTHDLGSRVVLAFDNVYRCELRLASPRMEVNWCEHRLASPRMHECSLIGQLLFAQLSIASEGLLPVLAMRPRTDGLPWKGLYAASEGL